MNNDEARMVELVNELNNAGDAYYNSGSTVMSDKEYDEKFDELTALEQKTGIILPDSPTNRPGSEAKGKRKNVILSYPAKSLGKTQDKSELADWLGGRNGVLSWKMDGQTIQLKYVNGTLAKAATRGNGIVGKDVTDAVAFIEGIPLHVNVSGEFVVRGESVMSLNEFERINALIPDIDAKYKNARNLAVGTLNTPETDIFKERKLNFKAFHLVHSDAPIPDSFKKRLDFLKELGFAVVDNVLVQDEKELLREISEYEKKLPDYEFPTDGLVLAYDDAVYGESLGSVTHHPKHSLAFKWKDTPVETKLLDVEWSPSKTGLLNPVAIFEPVEIEGTTVRRASIHNVNIFRNLMLGKNDRIMVYKANMIIPQVLENLTKSDTMEIPSFCPVCGEPTDIFENISTDGRKIETLYCSNPDCRCKLEGKMEHFVSRDGLDMDGISGKTIQLLYDQGWLTRFGDFFRLKENAEEMKKLPGMGKTAVENLLTTVEKSRTVDAAHLLDALSIPFVGGDASRKISEQYDGDMEKIIEEAFREPERLEEIPGIGPTVSQSIKTWCNNADHMEELYDLLGFLTIQKPAAKGNKLSGKTFVVTGNVHLFPNRDALHGFIQENGGKTAGSVSKNTSYLINNDTMSSSGKNKKAKELGIPVINEEEFMKMMG